MAPAASAVVSTTVAASIVPLATSAVGATGRPRWSVIAVEAEVD